MNRKFKIYLTGKEKQKFIQNIKYKIGFYLKLILNVKLIHIIERKE